MATDFRPQMISDISGITVRDELRWRAWNGCIADLWGVRCEAGASGRYVSRAPRLFVLLGDIEEGGIDIRDAAGRQHRLDGERRLCFVPAGYPIESFVDRLDDLRHLDLHFDIAALDAQSGGRIHPCQFLSPRIGFSSHTLSVLASLIADDCTEGRRDDLYGESLVLALLTELLDLRQATGQQPDSGLSRRQMNRVIDYVRANIVRNLSLAELAALIGLSPDHFGVAFRTAVGKTPHQFLLHCRVEAAKELLLHEESSLSAIAVDTGFSDQAHFTRVFRRLTGRTPALWRREQRAQNGPVRTVAVESSKRHPAFIPNAPASFNRQIST
ncbi:AraC family transcriptional regulator [Pleomorphomonas sp. NRK KF1]|uniref:AraC family transcriptional regulator n=1 Tax=Pleomorphomonas sp. NRK KF1 TaxID=2943000 RepID=UPI0020430961|nr:AraC family transcriptional regulator [Pleomorphomonas sp. NRK KF1]MCM5553457.1 AraC family transcriptional regulator [Pleomorphomonas sp. NRK KF1]